MRSARRTLRALTLAFDAGGNASPFGDARCVNVSH
jgi:hypothetical protein